MSWHPSCDGVYCVSHFCPACFEHVCQLSNMMLRLCDRQSVSRHEDDRSGITEQYGGFRSVDRPDGTVCG